MNKEIISEKLKEYRLLMIGMAAAVILVGVYFLRTGPAADLKDQGMATYAEIEKILDIMPAAGPASCENTQTGKSAENCKPPR